MASRKLRRFGAPLVLLWVMATAGFAGTINITTGGSGWTVSNIGASTGAWAAATIGSNNSISINANGNDASATMINGATTSTWDGFWVAYYTFVLPTGVTNPSLSFSRLYGDDRVVLELNPTGYPGSTNCTSNVIASSSWSASGGNMNCSDTASLSSFTFTSSNNLPNAGGTNLGAGMFNIGATNYLVAILNNTGTPNMSAGKSGFTAPGDQAVFAFDATVSYTDPASGVPEPSTVSYLLIGALPLAYRLGKRWVR